MPSYDAALPPARAVLAVVPQTATTVTLTDFAALRDQVGLPELTSGSSREDRSAFQARARAETALLSPGLLGRVDDRLRSSYGFGVDDVLWEAHFSGGGTHGWVIALRTGLDRASVRRAVRDGVGPLRGAAFDAPDLLLSKGIAPRGAPVWAVDPVWARLVPATGEAFVLRRGCVAAGSLPAPRGRAERLLARIPPDRLEPLTASVLTFGDHVATVRMSRNRLDLFDRLSLTRRWPLVRGVRFGQVFRAGVGDPSTGRIGFDVPRPARAVALLRSGLLPYAVCDGPA
jgi:hypothetical protein